MSSPGPWRWKTTAELGLGDVGTLLDKDGAQVCDFGNGMRWEESAGTPPGPADAAFIADAPAMLELLRELEVDGEGSCPTCGKLFPRSEGHIDERAGVPCRLGVLLDKHGRG